MYWPEKHSYNLKTIITLLNSQVKEVLRIGEI